MPTDIGPTSHNKVLNSIMSSSHITTSNTCSINVNSGDCLVHPSGSSYTVNMAHVTYWCSQAIYDSISSLIDRGANTGLAGTDICMLKYTKQYADITGVDQSSINALPLVTCAGTVHMMQGLTVLILNQ